MTVHFVHIGKTGGTAVKTALRRAGLAYWHDEDAATVPATPYGRIQLHRHRFRLRDVPPGDYAFFCVRDPIARFFSGFYSRLHKGQPRFYVEWSEQERIAFEAFPTPQRLAAALASDDAEERMRAHEAMRHIRHLGSLVKYLGTPRQLRARMGQILYIATQETLNSDWQQLKSVLELPPRLKLPAGPVRAHRRDPSLDKTLDDAAAEALRDWYRRDYRLLRYCELVRASRGWGPDAAPPEGVERLRHEVRRLRALLPPPGRPGR